MILDNLVIRDKKGNTYRFTDKNENNITEVHYCTSYYQFVVQLLTDDGKWEQRDLIHINKNPNPLDLFAIRDNEICEILESEDKDYRV